MRRAAARSDRPGRTVVLVNPNARLLGTSEPLSVSPPLGLLYVAASLEQAGIPVAIVDALAENLSLERTLTAVADLRPSHVGFGFMTPTADLCAEMAVRLPPGVASIAGGPHASAVPEAVLKSGFDIVVRGEGEATLPEVVSGRGLSKVSRARLLRPSLQLRPRPGRKDPGPHRRPKLQAVLALRQRTAGRPGR